MADLLHDGPADPQVEQLVEFVARRVAAETVRNLDVEAVAERVALRVLTRVGIDPLNPHDMQADFLYLRELRETCARVKSRSVLAVMSTILVALLTAAWVGFQHLVGMSPG